MNGWSEEAVERGLTAFVRTSWVQTTEEPEGGYYANLMEGIRAALNAALPSPPVWVGSPTREEVAAIVRRACVEGHGAFPGYYKPENAADDLLALFPHSAPSNGWVLDVKALLTLLVDVCQIIDVVRQEWGAENAWSEWDQSVRNRISETLTALYAAPPAPGDAGGWRPMLAFPWDYPDAMLSVAAVDDETGEVALFLCRYGDHGDMYPKRYGEQDKRPGMEWISLAEDGWRAYAWTTTLPPLPAAPNPTQKEERT